MTSTPTSVKCGGPTGRMWSVPTRGRRELSTKIPQYHKGTS